MTPRTVSLLLLSLVALALSALTVGAFQRFAAGSALASPWVVPLFGVLCYTATFFAGRRYILPFEIARSPWPSIVLLAAITGGSLLVVSGIVRAARVVTDHVPGGVVIGLWFFALWSAVATLHRVVQKSRVQ